MFAVDVFGSATVKHCMFTVSVIKRFAFDVCMFWVKNK